MTADINTGAELEEEPERIIEAAAGVTGWQPGSQSAS